jgi:aminopeptidase YwaD
MLSTKPWRVLAAIPALTGGVLLPLALWAGDIDPQLYMAHVRYLASPELKGRATGSPELEKAATYIANQFRSFGLKPIPGQDYKLPFPVAINARLGSANRFNFSDDGTRSLAVDSDFVPFSFSSSGKFAGGVVFAGYGITAQAHYDDYAGIDVKDKIVLILRHEPKEDKELSLYARFDFKASNAKAHGARGVIVINDVWAHEKTPETEESLPKFIAGGDGPKDSGVFFVQVKAATAEQWLKAEGRDLHQIWSAIDRDQKPQSFVLSKLRVDLSVEVLHDDKIVNNVAAFLPGATQEYVIVGAHYDHLGMGDSNSLAPAEIGKSIHPGADDNASGTAGVIELARWFSKHPPGKRGILFMTFAGEELGLLGSSWYAEHPLEPLGDAVAMINMDMIGRIREGKVYLGGSGTGTTFAQVLESVKAPAPLKIEISEKTGYGSSDHTSFTVKQVPVLFLFSGLHGDYHKPSDTADKIDAADAAKTVEYVADIATRLATDEARPKFVRLQEPTLPPASSGGGSGYGPAFGSIPDFNEPAKGVRFADVRDGTPAAKAGLKAGDILIEFDGRDIGNLVDFTVALRAHKPGDLVLVKVLRGSQTIEAKVLLAERR